MKFNVHQQSRKEHAEQRIKSEINGSFIQNVPQAHPSSGHRSYTLFDTLSLIKLNTLLLCSWKLIKLEELRRLILLTLNCRARFVNYLHFRN